MAHIANKGGGGEPNPLDNQLLTSDGLKNKLAQLGGEALFYELEAVEVVDTFRQVTTITEAQGDTGPEETTEPGEFSHGWQYYAADIRERAASSFVFETASLANKAELRSQSGEGASAWLTAIPTSAILTMQPSLFLTAMRRRLLLPLTIGPSHCRCREILDPYGYHIISCGKNGGPQRRAGIMEQAWRQVLREAGAHVNDASSKPLLRNLNIPGILPSDGRQLDILATGIGRVPLCADVTLRSPLSAMGFPHSQAADVDGSTFKTAYSDKARQYPELHPSDPRSLSCRFLTLAVETGGRFCTNCTNLFRELVECKARSFPHVLQRSMQLMHSRRWWGILSVAVQTAVGSTLVPETLFAAGSERLVHTFALPLLEELVGGHREAPMVSRLV